MGNVLATQKCRPHAPPMRTLLITTASVILHVMMNRTSDKFYFGGKYPRLALAKIARANWNSRVVSNIHASLLFAFAMAWLVLDIDGSGMLSRFRFEAFSTLASDAQCYSAGYFIYDLILVVKYFPALGSSSTVIHHVLAIVSILASIVYRSCALPFIFHWLTEFTTPLANQRWFLDVLNKKGTKVYLANGSLLWVAWLFARVFLIAFWWRQLYRKWKPYFEETAPSVVKFLTLANSTIIASLNIYWFVSLTKGLSKQFGIASSRSQNATTGK